MKKHLPDLVLLLLLGVAVAEGALLAARPRGGRVLLAAQQPSDPPGLLMGPGRAEQVLATHLATVGEWITVEDLVRGALLLQEGRLPGVAPLSETERTRLAEALERARVHRDELLAVEAEIRTVEAALAERAREAVRALTPEQRAWILARRDEVSVGAIERPYWEALARALEQDPP
ncbi:MAG: hypothetical protein JXB39_14605 [Deltaproteobacteria bacterium]|nr:hypothetical protein [Deltaproteobacteria bacterium]